jgi:hypothetical protein
MVVGNKNDSLSCLVIANLSHYYILIAVPCDRQREDSVYVPYYNAYYLRFVIFFLFQHNNVPFINTTP